MTLHTRPHTSLACVLLLWAQLFLSGEKHAGGEAACHVGSRHLIDVHSSGDRQLQTFYWLSKSLSEFMEQQRVLHDEAPRGQPARLGSKLGRLYINYTFLTHSQYAIIKAMPRHCSYRLLNIEANTSRFRTGNAARQRPSPHPRQPIPQPPQARQRLCSSTCAPRLLAPASIFGPYHPPP
jgi:hypothetical protein